MTIVVIVRRLGSISRQASRAAVFFISHSTSPCACASAIAERRGIEAKLPAPSPMRISSGWYCSTIWTKLARWNGVEWNPLGDGLTGGPLTPTVRDFAERNGHLYMTGNFLYAGGKLSAGLARWDQGSTGVVDDPVPAPAAPTLAVWPNPANPRFNVELRMPSAQPVRLTVLDVSGRHLATLHEGALDEGDHVFTWDGRDDAGRPLASGVYLLGLTGPAGSQGKRLVLLR